RAHADGAGLHLQPSQFRAFVDLDVRAKFRGQALHPLGHESEVAPCHVEIQDQGRRDQIAARPPEARRISRLVMTVQLSNHRSLHHVSAPAYRATRSWQTASRIPGPYSNVATAAFH